MKIKVINTTSKATSITVSDQVFGKKNEQLLAQSVLVYLSNKRQGTSKTKTRSEVSRTTRKWYKQKGTGNARHGARDATLFVGGGIAHGPTGLENWNKSLTKQQKKQALVAALSAQIENIIVNDEIETVNGKTKLVNNLLNEILKTFNKDLVFDQTKILTLVDEKNDQLNRATNNISSVRVMLTKQVNSLVIAQADLIIMSKKALVALQKRVEK